jgi:hypothetical protein
MPALFEHPTMPIVAMAPAVRPRAPAQHAVRRRSGVTLLEVVVSALLLGMMVSVAMQMFKTAGLQRRAIERRHVAIREAGNVLERIAALPWARLTPQSVGEFRLSEAARQALPGAELAVELTEPGQEPGMKRIAVRIGWQDRPEAPPRPVQAVSFRYRVERPPGSPEGGPVR